MGLVLQEVKGPTEGSLGTGSSLCCHISTLWNDGCGWFFFFLADVQAEAGCHSVAECFQLMGEEVSSSISRTERK